MYAEFGVRKQKLFTTKHQLLDFNLLAQEIAEESFKQERGDISSLGGGTYTGPRGGRYRINSNGRKSYDVP